jgi:hypothetical protein
LPSIVTTFLAIPYLFFAFAERVKTAGPDWTALARIRTIGLALRDYSEENGALPPAAVYGPDGKALLSWRVLLLPYLVQKREAKRGLFEQFKLDEPWDSPHNIKLLDEMPEVYALPGKFVSTLSNKNTHFRVFVGKGAAFEGTEGVSLEEFPDGRDGTLLVVEAADAVPWTKPDELPFGPGIALPRLGAVRPDRFVAVLGDVRGHLIPKEIGEETLRAFITRNGGEAIDPDWDK